MATAADVLKTIQEKEVKFVDLRFTDTRGKEQHVSVPSKMFDNAKFEDGHAFDGSSIAGWKGIEASDMLLMPDPATAYIDPFMDETTLNITCDVVEPSDGKGYERDPRSLAKRAEAYLKARTFEKYDPIVQRARRKESADEKTVQTLHRVLVPLEYDCALDDATMEALIPEMLGCLEQWRTEGRKLDEVDERDILRLFSRIAAHAVHPNYADRHEPHHRPRLNGGPVIKHNAQQRYATCGRTAALFADLCERSGVPVQHYVHRTDLPCGSTIGPITSTQLGIPTVDVGNPMLSMHSARECAGARDPELMVRALACFLASRDELPG